MASLMDKLKSLGIGVKGPVQQFHENDPYGRFIAPGGGMVRGEPMTPEILEARRRYHASRNAAMTEAPSTPYSPKSYNPDIAGVQALSPFGLFTKKDTGGVELPVQPPYRRGPIEPTRYEPALAAEMADVGANTDIRMLAPEVKLAELGTDWQDQHLADETIRKGRLVESNIADLVTNRYQREIDAARQRKLISDTWRQQAGQVAVEDLQTQLARNMAEKERQKAAELAVAGMDFNKGLFGGTYQTSTGTAPYSAERNWGQPGVYIGGGSPGAEIQDEMQRQAALESAGMDFNLPLNGSTYQTTTGTAPTPPVTNWGQSAFPYIGQSGAGGEEIMDAMPPEPPAIVQEAPVVRSSQATLVDQPVKTEQPEVLVNNLVSTHLSRLGFDPTNTENIDRLNELADVVGMIESDGDLRAKNKQGSSARGLYQFLTNDSKGQSSLQTAVKRVKKYVTADWLDEVAKTGKVEDLTKEQQTLLFFGDILEKSGSDDLIKKLLDPTSSQEEINQAKLDIYLKLHHTKPNRATINRAKRFIFKPELPTTP